MELSADTIEAIREPHGPLTERLMDAWYHGSDALLYEESRDGQRNLRVVDLENIQPNPRRKTGTVTVSRLDDFLDYVPRYKQDAVVFADPERFRFTAILNYHAEKEGAAGWGDFRAVYQVQNTPEWESWRTLASQGWVAQEDLAEFLEDHAIDVTDPNPEELFDTVSDLRLKAEAKFERAVRLANGTTQYTWREEVEQDIQQGQIGIPERLTVSLLLWEGDTEKAELRPRLRHRLREGKVQFALIFGDEVTRMLRARFSGFADTIGEMLGDVPVLFGSTTT